MTAGCCATPINVAGMVIHVAPGRKESVLAALPGLPGVNPPAATEDWRIAATAIDTGEAMAIDQLAAMNRIPGVVTAMLAYHEIDHPDEGAPCACAEKTSAHLPERA